MEMLILPFGILPVVFFVLFMLYFNIDEVAQKRLLSKFRKGITEYPTDISLFLCGENENTLEYTEDGKSIFLTITNAYCGEKEFDVSVFKSAVDLYQYYAGYADCENMLDKYLMQEIYYESEANSLKVLFTVPFEIVCSKKYIMHELLSLGRVFKRNAQGNTYRSLIYNFSSSNNHLSEVDGRVFLHVGRHQHIDGFFGYKEIVMSSNQIIRNIKNRLWNRLDVKLVSMDAETFCGEIIGLKKS